MWWLLTWWRNWRRRDSKLLAMQFITLDLEMFSATPALDLNRKQWSCVWSVEALTVKFTFNTRISSEVKNTIWWMPLDDCRRSSAFNMIKCWKFTAVLISSVSVCCVWWMNTKIMTLYQLQQHNRETGKLLLPGSWVAVNVISLLMCCVIFFSLNQRNWCNQCFDRKWK